MAIQWADKISWADEQKQYGGVGGIIARTPEEKETQRVRLESEEESEKKIQWADTGFRAVTGFINNLRLPWHGWKDFIGSPAGGALGKEGMVQNTAKWLWGEKPEDTGDPALISISNQMGELEAANKQDTSEYAVLSDRFDEISTAEESSEISEFSFNALREAFKEDAGAVTAELTNVIMADPQLLAIPGGWTKLATKAAEATAHLGKVAQVTAKISAGAAGAGALGAGLLAPISLMDQMANEDDIDWQKVGQDTRLGAGFGALLGGAVVGAKAIVQTAARGLRPRPEAAPEALRSIGASEALAPNNTLAEGVKIALGKSSQVGRDIVDFWGGKSITYLDKAAARSPAMRKIRNTMEYTEFSETAVAASHYERVSIRTGDFMGRLQDAVDKLRSPFLGRIKESANDALAAALRGGKATGSIKATADDLRVLIDDIRNYGREAGLDIGFVQNYLPRLYLRTMLQSESGAAGLMKVYNKHGIPIEDAYSIVRKITNEDGILVLDKLEPKRMIEGGEYIPGRRYTSEAPTKNKHLESARKLEFIPDEELKSFINNNVFEILSTYIRGTVRRAEYAQSFGPGEGKLNKLLGRAAAELDAAGQPLRRKELQRVYDIADAMQMKFRPIHTKVWRDINKGVGAYQIMRTLSLATISSLSEPWVILSRGRLNSTIKTLPKVLDHIVRGTIRTVYKKFPKAESTRALENVGIGLDMAVAERLTASFGGEVTKATNAFFKASLLHQWTRLNRVAGFHAGKQMLVDNLKDLAGGVRGAKQKRYLRELAELGVDADEGMSWVMRGMPDDDFTKILDVGGLRFVNEVVMSPRPTVRPMWHSNPHYHLLSQLKGFQTVFGNTVVKRWFDLIFNRGIYEGTRNAAKVGATGVIMIMTAMLGNELRELIKYGSKGHPKFKNEGAEARLIRAIDRTGMTGAFQFAIDATYAHRFGSSGVSQIAGPAISQFDQLVFKGIGMALEGNTNKLKYELVNAIPIINTNKKIRNDILEQID